MLTVKGTIFIDGSIYISAGRATARYTGEATIVASGTFGMKKATRSAPPSRLHGRVRLHGLALGSEPDRARDRRRRCGGAGNAQGQGSDFNPGDGIELKSAGFQGALIANQTIRNETTAQMQGPMISVYDGVVRRPERRH